MDRLLCVACLLSLLTATPGAAQPVPGYGIDFARIGDLGNPDASPQEFTRLTFDGWGPVGGVDYEFFVSRPEMTVAHHLEYVRAYVSTYTTPPVGQQFTGMWIFPSPSDPSGYRANPAVLNYPTNIS